jgi:hypothetical protein
MSLPVTLVAAAAWYATMRLLIASRTRRGPGAMAGA